MKFIKKCLGAVVLSLSVLLCACAGNSVREGEIYVYYVNADGNALIRETYNANDARQAIGRLKERGVLTGNAELEKFDTESVCLNMYFGDRYYRMAKSTEVLKRAAIVQTMTQIEGIDFVKFYVGGETLNDAEGNPVGMMRAEDFVQNTGSSIDSYQTADLTLYFADTDGKKLKRVKRSSVRYNANTSIEKLVMDQLMKGTSAPGTQDTVPDTSTLIGMSVRDGICYVNFDSKFSSDSYPVRPEVAIYSVVDSIISNGSVDKVQIMIEGANDVKYKGAVNLDKPLEWNGEIITGE